MDPLGPLAARGRVDVDLALERVVRVGEAKLALARRRTGSGRPGRKLPCTAVKVSRNMVRAVPSISRMAWISDWRAPTRSSRCAVRNSSRFTSSACSSTARAFTGPMASSASVMRAASTWRVSRSRSSIGRLSMSWSKGRCHSASTRSTMLRRVPAASVRRTWSAWLSSLPDSSAVRALDDLALGRAERRLGVGQRRLPRRRPPPPARAARPRVRRGSRATRLLRAPATASSAVELGELRGRASDPPPRPRPASRGARSSRSVGRAKPAGDVGFLHLPVDPLLAGGFLLGLEIGQAGAGGAQLLVQPAARELALDEGARRSPSAAAPSASRRSVRRASWDSRVGGLAGQVAGDARRRPPGRRPPAARRLAGLLRRRRRRRPGRARARPAAQSSPRAPTPRPPRALAPVRSSCSRAGELGPAAERAARVPRRRRGRSRRWRGEAPGRRRPGLRSPPARRAATGAAGPSARSRSLQRLASPPVGGPGINRQQDQGARLLLGMPRLDRAHRRRVPHQHGVHPVAEQPLGQLGVLAAGGRRSRSADRARRRRSDRGPRAAPPRAGARPTRSRSSSSSALPPGGELGQRLLRLAPVRAVHRLALAGLGDQVAGVLGLARRRAWPRGSGSRRARSRGRGGARRPRAHAGGWRAGPRPG